MTLVQVIRKDFIDHSRVSSSHQHLICSGDLSSNNHTFSKTSSQTDLHQNADGRHRVSEPSRPLPRVNKSTQIQTQTHNKLYRHFSLKPQKRHQLHVQHEPLCSVHLFKIPLGRTADDVTFYSFLKISVSSFMFPHLMFNFRFILLPYLIFMSDFILKTESLLTNQESVSVTTSQPVFISSSI